MRPVKSPRKSPAQKPRPSSRVASVAAGASWMALVAATTLGLGPVQRVRAEISSEFGALADGVDGDGLRLIVQSYTSDSVDQEGRRPGEYARPLGSFQRAVTADELRRGVAVDVVQVAEAGALATDRTVVVAWIEQGRPDLEFDALRARPPAGVAFGVSRSAGSDEPARVVLRRARG